MLRFEHKIVIFIRPQEFDNWCAESIVINAMADYAAEIRFPLTKVVIDVYTRHPMLLGAPLKSREIPSHRQCLLEQFFGVRKIQVVNDIYQE